MKYLLLASGQIVEQLLQNTWFLDEIKKNLCGFITTESIFNLYTKKNPINNELPHYFIGDKSLNELQLEDLIIKTRPNVNTSYPTPTPFDCPIL